MHSHLIIITKCFRQTQLLESHVSGHMVKKEVTQEGEVRFNINIITLLAFQGAQFVPSKLVKIVSL